jgi:hypothetical protein
MKCPQVKELLGLYLDAELDARRASELRHHLAECAGCDALCQAEHTFQSLLSERLKQTGPAPSVWPTEEAFVRASFPKQTRQEQSVGWADLWRRLLWPSPAYYAGLAAVWLGLFLASPASFRLPPLLAAVRPPGVAAPRLVLLEQRLDLGEWLGVSEAAIGDRTETKLTPHSQRKLNHEAAGLAPVRPDGLALGLSLNALRRATLTGRGDHPAAHCWNC